jgi:hypothetical protein
MRQGPNKRSRGRNGRGGGGGGGGKPHVPLRMQTFDSSGPDIRIRGNAWQVHERYLTLARDAHQAGDRVAAENFYQHADHYYRLINVNGEGRPPQHGGPHPQHGQPMPPGAPQPGPNGNGPQGPGPHGSGPNGPGPHDQHGMNGPANGVEQPELDEEPPVTPVPVGD